MSAGVAKKYINLHAEIDEDGALNLVDEDGRILAGVKRKSIHTAHDDVSTADIEIVLKSSNKTALAMSKVK